MNTATTIASTTPTKPLALAQKIKLPNGRLALAELGRVKFVPQNADGLCYVNVMSGSRKDVFIPLMGQHAIIAGVDFPEMIKIPVALDRPQRGQEIVFFRPRPETTKAFAWGFVEDYKGAAAEIADRPIYQLWQETRYKGALTSNPRQILVEGSLVKMEVQLGSMLHNLPEKSMDFSHIYHWEQWVREKWVPCRNPLKVVSVVPKATPKITPMPVTVVTEEEDVEFHLAINAS